jgi:hypothetical protein
MIVDDANPWRKAVLREIKAGRMSVMTAARVAGVSRIRVRQWCADAKIDPRSAFEHRLAQWYARELLKMKRRDFERLRKAGKATEDRYELPPFMRPLLKRKARPKVDKQAARTEADSAVIDFMKAGGKVKRIKEGVRALKKPL